MGYDKGSFDSFKAALKASKYETATGARRAIGKFAQLSAEEKDKARKLVDAHFGETSSATKAPKAAAKTAAAPKAAKPVTRQPQRAAAAPVVAAPKGKPGRPARTPVTTQKIAAADVSSLVDDLSLGERIVTAATQALSTLEGVKNAFEGVDTAKAAAEYTRELGRTVGLFRRVVSERLGAEAPSSPVGIRPVSDEESSDLPNGTGHSQPYFPELENTAHA